jgi:hypothetical protein
MQTQELPALLVLLTMILTSPPRGFSSHPHHPQGLAPAALQALNPSTPWRPGSSLRHTLHLSGPGIPLEAQGLKGHSPSGVGHGYCFLLLEWVHTGR